ncbi:MAG: GNAT family N-acetyltransferase [Peptostreptococcaceae bacterium]|jgi:ribosomal protein S18 acetylase RimI-like enzyme|nr:GNAT family N-acetyltransferase [Peptostreptococcaceae bacterium]
MIIRKIKTEDANNFLNMALQLDKETKDMMLEEGERKTTSKQMKEGIEKTINSGSVIFIIEDKDKIVGFLKAYRGEYNRIKHSAHIVVGILRAYRGKKLGTKLFEQLDIWAVENNIKRLDLTVIKSNEIALNLYKKMGFKIEGLKEKTMIVDGVYKDEYCLAKIYE